MTDIDQHVRLVPLSEIKPSARNPRKHSAEQISQIVASIKEWGWTVPLLVDEKCQLIAGHGRLLAAQQLGLKTVPTLTTTGWTEAQKRAYIIADNKLGLNSTWDMELLKLELDDIAAANFSMDLLGFTDDEWQEMHGKVGLTDPDQVPDLPEHPIAKPGDIWLLGKHRLVCGDCTNPSTVSTCLNGAEPHLMVTDPPYGVNYDPTWRKRAGVSSANMARGKSLNDDRADWREAWALFPGVVAYVWHGGLHAPVVAKSLEDCRFDLRAQIVWVKTRAALSRGNYHWQHEPCLYGVKEGEADHWRYDTEHELATYVVKDGKPAEWRGGRKQSTVWFIEHVKCDTGHGSQKPVECMRRPIENNSGAGQAVYDPFLGSGTTIIAAEITGRVCYAIEIDPAYIDVAVKRWQDFTGETATRELRRDEHGRTQTETDASESDNRQSGQEAAQQA